MQIPHSLVGRIQFTIGILLILWGILLTVSILGMYLGIPIILIGIAFLYDYILECLTICIIFLIIYFLIIKNYFIALSLFIFTIFLIKESLKKILRVEKEKKYSKQERET